MNIAEALEAAAPARIVRSDAKVVTLDIERLPGRAVHKHRGLTIEGDFWDLNSWKHTLGYRLPPESVVEWPRNICVAWKWYDRKRVEFASEWGDGAEEMHRKVWQVYDSADIVVGHNLDNFDTKKLATAWAELGWPLPTPFKTVDTLKIARKRFGAESNTLDSLCQRFGITGKSDRYSVEMARAACAGNRKAQRQITAYCKGDVFPATEGFYDYMRGWMPEHPHIGALDETKARCNQCGCTDLLPSSPRLAEQIRYKGYRCANCRGNLQSVRHSRAANVRGAR